MDDGCASRSATARYSGVRAARHADHDEVRPWAALHTTERPRASSRLASAATSTSRRYAAIDLTRSASSSSRRSSGRLRTSSTARRRPRPAPSSLPASPGPDDLRRRTTQVVRYLIRRLFWAIVLFIAVTLVTYVIFFLIPADPAKLACRQGAHAPEEHRARRALPRASTSRSGTSTATSSSGSSSTRSLGRSFATRSERQRDHLGRRAGHRLARLRRRDPLAARRAPDRHPLGAAAALALRPRCDGLRADRHLGAPVWIGLIFPYFFGYKLG